MGNCNFKTESETDNVTGKSRSEFVKISCHAMFMII